MILRSILRTLVSLSLGLACSPGDAAGQILDRTLSSMVGGVVGGFSGIVGSLPRGCGGVFSDRNCTVNTVAKGFGLGNVVGSALGAARSGVASSCNRAERFGRSLIGTSGGGGLALADVSRTHGNLRIGLTPLVQLAEGMSAAAMLSGCSWTPSHADSAALRFSEECQNPSRGLARAAADLGLTGGYAGLYLYFHHAWWSGTPAPKWFIENDWDKEERDADKFGHLFGGYQLTRITSELLEAGCIPPSRAIAWGALYAYAFQFQIEEWDGTQQLYGFNPSDLIADAAGALFSVAQQHTKALQYIKPVWSYRPTEAYRRRNLPGHGGQPRATTDYSGQTYWFSTDIHGLLPDRAKPFWPSLIRLSPGYSITDYVNPVAGGALRAKRKILVCWTLIPKNCPVTTKSGERSSTSWPFSGFRVQLCSSRRRENSFPRTTS
ncbi:MAG: hypothetical protein DMD72_13085 [Gemmatimonadetes bacterium]|nr:MAG: hypothetical protein DMD72_13085 [Gemmatimonadota bacterium]